MNQSEEDQVMISAIWFFKTLFESSSAVFFLSKTHRNRVPPYEGELLMPAK
jgi:hypothetical protein